MVAIVLNLLAVKININSFSSTDRGRHQRLGTKFFQVTFHIKSNWLATLQFKESGKKKGENIYVAADK